MPTRPGKSKPEHGTAEGQEAGQLPTSQKRQPNLPPGWTLTRENTPQGGFHVIDRKSNASHGIYSTLEEAEGCVQCDRLADYEIWRGDIAVWAVRNGAVLLAYYTNHNDAVAGAWGMYNGKVPVPTRPDDFVRPRGASPVVDASTDPLDDPHSLLHFASSDTLEGHLGNALQVIKLVGGTSALGYTHRAAVRRRLAAALLLLALADAHGTTPDGAA
jgi:hypothetical protein